MSSRSKKLLSLLLVFVLVFQMVPATAFADGIIKAEGSAPTMEERPDPMDSIYYQGVSTEYTADDVLWEIEDKRTETEKHFHMANGSDIAVSYTFPVHYEDAQGEYQEIDNSLKLYNVDGTLSSEPVESGLTAAVSLETGELASMIAEAEPGLEPAETPAPTESPIPTPDVVVEATPAPSAEEEVVVTPETEPDVEEPDAGPVEVLPTDDAAEAAPVSEEDELLEADAGVIAAEEMLTQETFGEGTAVISEADEVAPPVEEETAPPGEEPETLVPEVIETEAPDMTIEEETTAITALDMRAVFEALPIDTRVYRNTAGLADVQLAVSGGSGQLASISYGDYTVTLTPQISLGAAGMNTTAAAAAEAVRRAGIAGQVRQLETFAEDDSFAARVLPENLSTALVYEGIMGGSDLEYIIGETSLKENIIVKEAADAYVYNFLLDTGGLVPELMDNGSIELRDGGGSAIFVIPAGYMIDANGVSSMEVQYGLQLLEGTRYTLTVSADEDWMNDAGRAFPVTIDPPVYLQGFYNIETGTIFQYYPDAIGGQRATEALGYYSANGGYCRTLVRVNSLPAIPDNSYVVNSGIYLYQVAYDHVGMNPMRVQAQALSWNYPTEGYWCLYHSWNDTPDPMPEVIDFTDVSSSRAFYGWNITREVIKWYNDPATNYGISLQATLEGSMNYASCANVGFASSNTSNDGARPFFVVEYRNCAGLEGYYSYQTHSIGRAGTGYIGDYSGQLTLVKEDTGSASTINPVSINHIYNSTYSGGEYTSAVNGAYGKYTSFSLGKGWMMDFMQIIVPSSEGYLLYVDGDGTAHYFYPSDGVYKDEDGLGLTISASGSNYTLRDKKDNIMYFAGGVLSYAQDANGNKVSYNMDSSGCPISVTRQNSGGSLETIATFQYDGYGNLYSITDSSSNVTTFGYTGEYLTTITHPDNTTVTYTYDAGGKLAYATDDESGYTMAYEYDGNTGKVNCFQEEVGSDIGACVLADGSFSGIQTYRYNGPDRTLYTDDDTISHSVLDYFGRTTSSYTTNADETLIYGASSTAYTLNSGVNATNNRALISTSTGTQSVNLLGYPSIEGTSNMASTPWSFSGGGSGAILFSCPRTGTRSMTIIRNSGQSDSFFSQTLTGLDPNRWYVLSGYVNTGSVTTFGSGKVTMTASGAQNYEGSYVNWDTDGVGDGWERIYVTAQPSSSGQLTLSARVSGLVGTIYLDDFQAELSLFDDRGTPGSASFLTNGSMSDYSGWSSWLSDHVSYVNDDTFGRVLRLDGDAYESIDVFQDIYTVLPGNQTYMLSGWAKGSAVPLQGSGHRSFSLWVELYYGDENGTTETHNIECNVDSEQWQYVALPIVPEHPELPVNAIRVYITFCRNPNTALFANLSLTREDAQCYKYNSDGELISVTSSENEPQSFSYSGADLIGQVTQGSGTLNYEYDDKHNVTKVTNDGLSMSASYDGKGNTTGTTLTGAGSSSKINSSAGYDSNGNLLTSQTDARGKSVTYSYDNSISKQTGQPGVVTDANGVETYNFYDNANGRISSVGIGYSPYIIYGYTNGRLTSMARTGSVPNSEADVTQTYTMSYDHFGRMSTVNVGNRNLACYSYGEGNGNLIELYYGTGDAVLYEYDALERVSDVYYNDDVYNPAVSYSYSNNGSLSRVDDYASGREYVYNYDALGRLSSMAERHGANGVQVYRSAFDSANRVSSMDYRVSPSWNGTLRAVRNYGYSYDSDNGSLSSMTLPAGGAYTYSYDALMRMTGRSLKVSSQNFLNRSYTFLPGTGTDGTTMMVAGMTTTKGDGSALLNYTYSYDDVGNITAISGSSNASYTYDDFGQLLSETVDGDTFTYSYDEVGNLLTATDYIGAHTYTYSDAQWKDLLTAYDGNAITYDAIGNPTFWYDSTSFTWDLGRRLMSASNSITGLNSSYTYDADGLRLTKTVNGVEHKYVWQGGRLVSEYYDGKELEFFYDESGAPYALSYKSGASAAPVMYYYVTNLQGDVVRLLDSSGSIKASYAYSAWGKLIDVSGDMADINPLRYRGYYYDADTDLYYLKSRYYDPQICRFINADGFASTGQGILGTNMFAYCLNNPVNMFDETGTWPSWATKLVTAVAVVAVVATVAAITVSTAGAGTAVAVIAVSAAKGSAIGMATGAAIGAGTNAINHRISTGSWSGAGTAALNGMGDGALSGAITGAVTGAASSAVKVGQAARAFDNGTFRSGYQSMKYHYNKHVVREGLNRRTNILQYADDAINFSNRNASMLRYKYNYNYGNASWNFAYSSGQGGMYTSTGKVLTFWYR